MWFVGVSYSPERLTGIKVIKGTLEISIYEQLLKNTVRKYAKNTQQVYFL